MVGEELIYSLPPEFVRNFGWLIKILQAVGVFIIFYIIFQIVNVVFNRKKRNELRKINSNLEEIKKILQKKK